MMVIVSLILIKLCPMPTWFFRSNTQRLFCHSEVQIIYLSLNRKTPFVHLFCWIFDFLFFCYHLCLLFIKLKTLDLPIYVSIHFKESSRTDTKLSANASRKEFRWRFRESQGHHWHIKNCVWREKTCPRKRYLKTPGNATTMPVLWFSD